MPQARLKGDSRSRGFAQSTTRGEQRLMTRTPVRISVSALFATAALFLPAIIQAAPQQNVAPVVAQSAPNPKTETVEVARTQPPKPSQIGFRLQGFEPSPLDPLSKLVLTEDEKKVSDAQLATLEEAKNALDFKITVNPLIQQFINYYQGPRGRATMESGLRRSGRYMKMAREAFRQEGVPEDLAWLGQIESSWSPKAFSSTTASGLWQFMP